MNDMEKVIKGVESCIKMGRLGVENCRELNCPYFENGLRLSCWIDVLNDAFALLKEQKSIIPWLSELMLNTNDEPIKPSEVIRRIEEGGLKRFAEEESQ